MISATRQCNAQCSMGATRTEGAGLVRAGRFLAFHATHSARGLSTTRGLCFTRRRVRVCPVAVCPVTVCERSRCAARAPAPAQQSDSTLCFHTESYVLLRRLDTLGTHRRTVDSETPQYTSAVASSLIVIPYTRPTPRRNVGPSVVVFDARLRAAAK
jgi:hypothetical protein